MVAGLNNRQQGEELKSQSPPFIMLPPMSPVACLSGDDSRRIELGTSIDLHAKHRPFSNQ